MEDNNNWLLTSLPKEIQYYLARFIDLGCLGALFFTSKQTHRAFHTDLAFQKIVRAATPHGMTMPKSAYPIRAAYNDALSIMAVKYNDASIMATSFEKISVGTILAKLRVNKIGYVQSKPKKDLTSQILMHDAENVLEFLLSEFTKKNDEKANKAIVKLFDILMTQCFGFKELDASPKSLTLVLKFFREHRKIFFRLFFHRIHLEKCAFTFLQAMLKSMKTVKYDLDLNGPVEVRGSNYRLNFEFEASPLEAAAFYGLKNVFHLLIDHGARLDLTKPYLPLLFILHRNDVTFFEYLQNLGADLNVRLPPKIFAGSILGFAADDFSAWDVEYLLLRGAKLLREEFSEFIGKAPSSNHYFIAIAQLDNYTIENRKMQILFPSAEILGSACKRPFREFKSSNQATGLVLSFNGEFTYKAKRIGKWIQRPDFVLELISRQEKKFVTYGSYDHADIVVDAPEIKYEFVPYRNHKNDISLVPFEDGTLPIHKLLIITSLP